jgi:molecular chaperone DnaJ
MANYYDVLGVSKDATQDQIKSQYRKLARQYHPDLHPNDEAAAQKFKEINEANEILSDPQKRQQYDYELDNPYAQSFGAGGGDPFAGFGDIFSNYCCGKSYRI